MLSIPATPLASSEHSGLLTRAKHGKNAKNGNCRPRALLHSCIEIPDSGKTATLATSRLAVAASKSRFPAKSATNGNLLLVLRDSFNPRIRRTVARS
jgi:hypothetical protein